MERVWLSSRLYIPPALGHHNLVVLHPQHCHERQHILYSPERWSWKDQILRLFVAILREPGLWL